MAEERRVTASQFWRLLLDQLEANGPPPSALRAFMSAVQDRLGTWPVEDRLRLARLVGDAAELPALTGFSWIDYVDSTKVLAEIDKIVASPDVESVGPEDLNRLGTKAHRLDINKLSPAQIFVLVLVWLLVVGIPMIQQELPKDTQSMIESEVGTLGLGLALTQMIISKGKRD